MTKAEEKQLLLKDLCDRLPYGVKIRIEYPFVEEKDWHTEDLYGLDLRREVIAGTSIRIEEFKPYLRPMSSMTEEEREEYLSECDRDNLDTLSAPHYHGTDWLNKKMFDYRGLIPTGLALEAKEGMYRKEANNEKVNICSCSRCDDDGGC